MSRRAEMRRILMPLIIFVSAIFRPGSAQTADGEILANVRIHATHAIELPFVWQRFGVPLSYARDLKHVDELSLRDSSRSPLPARFRVLSRWDGPVSDQSRPIKWLEITVAAPGRRGDSLTLCKEKRTSGEVKLTQTPELWTLSTDHFELELNTSGLDLIRSLKTGGSTNDAAPSGRVLYCDVSKVPGEAAPWTLHAESIDDAAATILATTSVGGLDLEWRIHVVHGAAEIVSDFRVINRGPYGHMERPSSHVYFSRLGLTLPGAGSGANLHSESLQGSVPADNDAAFSLLQQHSTSPKGPPPSETFPYEIWSQNRRLSAGEQASGSLVLEKNGQLIGLCVERFWENAPKSMFVSNGRIGIDFFPLGGFGPVHGGPYGSPGGDGTWDDRSRQLWRFEGARAKTTRFRLLFAKGSTAAFSGEVDRMARNRIHTSADVRDIYLSGAVGYPYDIKRPRTHEAGSRFERMMDILIDDQAADSQPSLGSIGLPRFVERGGTYGAQIFHGWFNFGDIAWGDGYCSLHYDWPLIMFLNYVRSGDIRHFERAEDMARHRADIDQDHDTKSNEHLRGGQFYEKGYWHGNYYHPVPSHTWLGGSVLHYFLTGDENSLEAARLSAAFLRRQGLDHWDGRWGVRIPGWAAEGLLWFWWAEGDREVLRHTRAILKRVESIETRKYGGQGFVINEEMKPKSEQPWMMNIFFNALAREAWLTGSRDQISFLHRMTRFFRDRTLLESARPDGPIRVYRHVAPKVQIEPDIHLAWPMASSFAWAYYVDKRNDDLVMARRLFRGAALYMQGTDKDAGGPIAFRLLNYPHSESKIFSNIGLWGHLVLPLLENH